MNFETVKPCVWQSLGRPVLQGLAIGSVWIAILSAAAPLGQLGYFLPFFAMLVASGCAVLVVAMNERGRSVVTALILGVLLLDINFRERALGDIGFDWQNGMKLVVWLGFIALALRHRAKLAGLLHDPGVALVVAFACFALASATWSPVSAYTAGSAIGNFAWLALALLSAAFLPDRLVFDVVMWSLLAEVVLGLAGAVLVQDVAWMAPQVADTEFRLQGFSGHPNLLAQHAAILVLVACPTRESGRTLDGARSLFIMIGLLALVLSGGRTAMFAAAAAFAIIVARRYRVARFVTMGLVATSSVVLLLRGTGQLTDVGALFSGLSRTGAESEISTLTGRTELWSIAWNHFLERPLLGWGFNGTEQLMAGSVGTSFEGNAISAHNFALQALMTLGVVGSAIVFAFFGMLMSRVVRAPDDARDLLTIFIFINGLSEAEFLTVPALLSFLVFWCIARDARRRGCPTEWRMLRRPQGATAPSLHQPQSVKH